MDELSSVPNDARRVVAAVQASSLPAGVTIQAHWSIDGTVVPGLDPEPIEVEEGRTDAWLAWTLTWNAEGPWPVGTLGIVIEVDGKPQLEDDIPIVRANV